MKKMNKKGFMLTETLIVSTMIITVLIVLYVQFKNVSRSFNDSFTYGAIGSSYNLYNAKLYVEQSNYSLMASKLTNDDYVDLTACPPSLFSETNYCSSLFSKLGIEQIIITNEDIGSFIDNNDLGVQFNKYMKSINYDSSVGYRLIASFKDGTYASVRVLNADIFDYVMANACNAKVESNYTIHHIALTDKTNLIGYDLTDDTKSSGGCGSSIAVAGQIYTDNACYFPYRFDREKIDLSLDENANQATIFYDRYESVLTIKHYEKGTTTSISPDTVINNYCGNKIIPEEYKKNIATYNYSSTENDNITLTKENATAILYYEKVG